MKSLAISLDIPGVDPETDPKLVASLIEEAIDKLQLGGPCNVGDYYLEDIDDDDFS